MLHLYILWLRNWYVVIGMMFYLIKLLSQWECVTGTSDQPINKKSRTLYSHSSSIINTSHSYKQSPDMLIIILLHLPSFLDLIWTHILPLTHNCYHQFFHPAPLSTGYVHYSNAVAYNRTSNKWHDNRPILLYRRPLYCGIISLVHPIGLTQWISSSSDVTHASYV